MKIKITLLIALALVLVLNINAQVKIGDNPTVINQSAALEVSSTNKGVLMPRLTNTQMLAIPSPVAGLAIYNTDKKKLCVYNGTVWACTNDQYGCTDSKALNYDSSATYNNGTCIYNSASVTPTYSNDLSVTIQETSGLAKWNSYLYTHNDSGDKNIYALDTNNGNIVNTYPLGNVANVDWEEISQDNNYFYIGDFGNNANGNRTDLRILRIGKTSLINNTPVIDTIKFSYSNQVSFAPTGANNTDFDCEAFIVSSDSIFLFTKQWVSGKTSSYSLSKTPGTHVAHLKSTLDVQGLITGATYLENKRLIAFCGYSNTLQPFIYLLYDFNGTNFFSMNKRKININLPFHQVEGIATTNGLKYFISNEKFATLSINQKLHIIDLSTFLNSY